MLSKAAAVDQTRQMLEVRSSEITRLETVRGYMRNEQPFDWMPEGVPNEVRRLAEISRINLLRYIVKAPTQSLHVDGYRTRETDEASGWAAWRRNRLPKRQIGIHRAALTYGASYSLVLPGELDGSPAASIRGVSPRHMTTLYAGDDDWPLWALEKRKSKRGSLWRLFDDTHAYWIGTDERGELAFVDQDEHGVGVVPVVRYLCEDNLDGDVEGVVWPHLNLQDQINVTTFVLLVAQHYGAHRQRYILGWLAENANEAKRASAQQLWTFEDRPDDLEVGEFGQTELGGMIESREATARFLATVSQTPVHELLGTIANLSAEALVAARDSHNRALEEYRTMFGESHEQTLELGAILDGGSRQTGAWVRWRDNGSRSLAQTADAFGKLVESLGIPPEAFWDRVADVLGISQDEVDGWRKMRADSGDSLDNLAAILERQMGGDDG